MIKLFVTDLDGCISIPFKTPDWELLSEIRRLNEQHIHDRAVPPLTICSGRPQPYVEAVAQWLNVQHPAGFENAGIYNVKRNELELLPAFNSEAAGQVNELKQWLQQEIVTRHSGMIVEFTKKMDAGVIHSDKEAIDEAYLVIREHVAENYPLFEVHKTDVSVNVILANNNKGNGISKLCEMLDIAPEEVAYIGDSSGDIPGLKLVGYPFAPANASDAVKECAEVLDVEVTEAVLTAYRRIIQMNREQLSQKISNQAS